jgi:flagella basal body P-ring formation protein FlgA
MFTFFSSSIQLACMAAVLVVALVSALCVPVPASAQTVGGKPEFLDTTQRWLDEAVSNVRPASAGPLRMEVTLGALDSRLRLAPCARVEPYIPVGTRLWGKTRLGLRCLEGSIKWNVFLPVTIKAYGAAWVVKGNVAPGVTLIQADAVEEEVDWAEEASPIISSPLQWVGQVAAKGLNAGQALRQSMIKPAQVFQAGAQVRIVVQGAGFQVTTDGQALSAGVVGQPARVRMDSGRMMNGTVLDSHTVRVDL